MFQQLLQQFQKKYSPRIFVICLCVLVCFTAVPLHAQSPLDNPIKEAQELIQKIHSQTSINPADRLSLVALEKTVLFVKRNPPLSPPGSSTKEVYLEAFHKSSQVITFTHDKISELKESLEKLEPKIRSESEFSKQTFKALQKIKVNSAATAEIIATNGNLNEDLVKNLRSLGTDNTPPTNWWTVGAMAGVGVLTAGGIYAAGKFVTEDAENKADKLLTKAETKATKLLNDTEARAKQILEDAKLEAVAFIQTQIDHLESEIASLTVDQIKSLQTEVLATYDSLIADAISKGDTALADKLKQARDSVQKFFDDSIKAAEASAAGATTTPQPAGDFALNDPQFLFFDAQGALEKEVPKAAASAKAAGKSGLNLQNACYEAGAKALGKAVSGLLSTEKSMIDSLCK